ncbi:MAG: hypothetical protein LBI74_00670, partial [Synergistaceae bacterium]|nr:hypothetical protein [Synergistaceae bacterium]
VLFRSESVAAAWRYLSFLSGANGWLDGPAKLYLRGGMPIFISGVIFSMPVAAWLEKNAAHTRGWLKDAAISVSLIIVFALSLLACISNSYNPFIYFNF